MKISKQVSQFLSIMAEEEGMTPSEFLTKLIVDRYNNADECLEIIS